MYKIEMFLTIKLHLHLNCKIMLGWIIWNRTVFNIKTVFTLNWIVTYNCLTSLKWKCFWQLNCVIMLKWIVLNRTYHLDLALNNLQRLICHKIQLTNQPLTVLKRGYWVIDGLIWEKKVKKWMKIYYLRYSNNFYKEC